MMAPSFWYETPGALANGLRPLGALFRMGGIARRAMTTPYQAKIPVICVGNVVAGGAGKTPTAMAVAQVLISQGASPIFVTRGYGGHQRGPIQVNPATHTVNDVGDEALLLVRVAPVWIGRNRAEAIRAAESQATHIVLDDGLQNPTVQASHSFLVIDGDVGLGNECVIPAGPLREKLEDVLERIMAVILVGDQDRHNIASRVACPVLRARMEANVPTAITHDQPFFAFAGIGRPQKFYNLCRESGMRIVGTHDFPDHHRFTENDLVVLEQSAAHQKAQLLTTEKDWIRLPYRIQMQTTVLPVKLVFSDPTKLQELINRTRPLA
jgi:tetraacyldisaccharide 4'-kinase